MAEITWKSILTKLVGGDHLTAEESEWFVDDLMQGNANPTAVGAALAMQQQLGLTSDEVRGAAKAMVSHAVPLNVSGETTDIVGTGGDGFATVNLSTMGSVAAAAAGVKIVKHGNRAASSKCGAAVDLGLAKITVDQLKGGVPDVNANTFKDFLAGKDIPSRTTALLNAASAIVADGNLVGNGTLAERFGEAYTLAEKTVDSGKAEALFNKWIETAKSKA